MHKTCKAILGITCMAIPLFAGALTLQIGNPAANPEAQSIKAAVVAQVLACHSPEKTTITAEAIGMVDGKQQTIQLKVLALAKPGMYAVTHEWPQTGTWVVKFVATNPEYKNYATGALIPAKGNTVEWMQAKNYFHDPNSEEVASLLQ
jgi:hypothetical protein